jgi:hypothetical protein
MEKKYFKERPMWRLIITSSKHLLEASVISMLVCSGRGFSQKEPLLKMCEEYRCLNYDTCLRASQELLGQRANSLLFLDQMLSPNAHFSLKP